MVQVMDYDAGGYDYRTFWQGRELEHRSETRVLDRLLRRGGPVEWFADLGGGFGRNVPLYQRYARNVVLVDYSRTNLRNAAALLAASGGPAAARVELVRADVYRLPFRDTAFDAAACVRLLHHLTDLDAGLAEMGRVVGGRWLVDVPIRHHLLARLRALGGRSGAVAPGDPHAPLRLGSDDQPYWNFDLGRVRGQLAEQGWTTRLGASVNNLRGWQYVVPAAAGRVGEPVVLGLELGLQRLGRGWWGPSQFLVAQRGAAPVPAAPGRSFVDLLACPDCHGALDVASTAGTADPATGDIGVAACRGCGARFACEDGIWDFTRACSASTLGDRTGSGTSRPRPVTVTR